MNKGNMSNDEAKSIADFKSHLENIISNACYNSQFRSEVHNEIAVNAFNLGYKTHCNSIIDIIVWLRNYQDFCYNNSTNMQLNPNGTFKIKTIPSMQYTSEMELLSQILIRLEKLVGGA